MNSMWDYADEDKLIGESIRKHDESHTRMSKFNPQCEWCRMDLYKHSLEGLNCSKYISRRVEDRIDTYLRKVSS